jgi:hypothetical protein
MLLDVVMIYADKSTKMLLPTSADTNAIGFRADGNLIQPKRNHPTINYGDLQKYNRHC